MFVRGGLKCITIAFVICTQPAVGDLFSSVIDMENLVRQEDRLMNTLHYYIKTQEDHLRLLNKKLEQLMTDRLQGQTVDISDPVKAFSLIRRLTREWPLTLNLMMMNTLDVGLQEELSRLPKEKDFDGAVRGLARLQRVYQTDTKQLTRYYAQLTAIDCFEMGKHFLNLNNYDIASSWFQEASEMINTNDKSLSKEKLMPYLFFATYLSGCKNSNRPVGDFELLRDFMLEYPDFTLDKDTSPLFNKAFSSPCSAEISGTNELDEFYEKEFRIYSDTCRRQGGVNSPSELRCFYIHHNNPRLLIAPFKMEEASLDPPILIFHEVISDQEISEIMTVFSKVRRTCSIIIHENDTNPFLDDYRTCDVGWITDHDTPVDARITQRVGDMTNLDMETSELSQVASYGLGGAYLLHWDPIPEEDFDYDKRGGRIATFMFYLNDVEEGGHTAFPIINAAIKPVKGSAVFWFNLDHRSAEIYSTYHGGCPVVRGSKWVLNKWIHEGKQKGDMFCPVDEKFPKPRYYANGIKR